MAQMVRNLPAMQDTWVWSLGQEDPLEKGMATHSSILAWRNPWSEEPSELQSTGSHRVGHYWATKTYIKWQGWLCASAFYIQSQWPINVWWSDGKLGGQWGEKKMSFFSPLISSNPYVENGWFWPFGSQRRILILRCRLRPMQAIDH